MLPRHGTSLYMGMGKHNVCKYVGLSKTLLSRRLGQHQNEHPPKMKRGAGIYVGRISFVCETWTEQDGARGAGRPPLRTRS